MAGDWSLNVMTAEKIGKARIIWSRGYSDSGAWRSNSTRTHTHTQTHTIRILLLLVLGPCFENHWARFWALLNRSRYLFHITHYLCKFFLLNLLKVPQMCAYDHFLLYSSTKCFRLLKNLFRILAKILIIFAALSQS